MKKVLIITYYWPPSGGAGVQRWLKFVKYLREFGWEPIVYTPENPEPPDFDESLLEDIPDNLTVIKRPVWEPYNLYKYFTGQKKNKRITHGFLKEEGKESLLEKFSVWVRGNFFIPDARCFWIKPSVKFLVNYLQQNPVNAIVSSGPPHSMHLIALGVKKKLNIPWLADFRDPWTEIDFYNKLMLTRYADRKHKMLEIEVLQSADMRIAIGEHLANRLENIANKRVEVITNGFDESDFDFLPVKIDDCFTITHLGSLNKDRNPESLWQAITELCSENEEISQELKLKFVGKTDIAIKENLRKYGLESRAEFVSYLPHKEALEMAASSKVLLLLINRTQNQDGIVTGKIFEYLAIGRPILSIGPVAGESAKIITESGAGIVCGFDDVTIIKSGINNLFLQWNAGSFGQRSSPINRFSRKSLTKKLSNFLNSL